MGIEDEISFVGGRGISDSHRKLIERMESLKVPHFGRLHRRKSLSCPNDVNILLQIAEYNWQHKPNEKDYFDELEEVGQKSKIQNQPQQQQHLNITSYEPVRSDESEVEDYSSDFESPRPILRFVTESNKPKQDEDDDDEEYSTSIKRSRRKSATRPPNLLGVHETGILGGNSNVDGVVIHEKTTLINTIRIKMANISKSIPNVFKKKKTKKDYKIQIFVSLMFLVIVILVGCIYVIHSEKELEKAYFGRIRFSSKDRHFQVSNLRGREVLNGILGTSLTIKDKAWNCLEKDRLDTGTCLEWMNIARLYFRPIIPRRDWDPSLHNMECYEILWKSLNVDFVPMDCFDIGEGRGFFFYGGGELDFNQWPLNRSSVPLSPFITGSKIHGEDDDDFFQWGRSIRRYFVGSPGIGIEISKHTPLHISINDKNNPGMMCFAAKKDGFAYPNYDNLNILNYTLCSGDNIRDVFTQLADKEIWDGLKHEDVHFTHAMASAPIWRILPETIQHGLSTEAALLNHTDDISSLQLSEGFLLLDETWQNELGDLEFDPNRFINMAETVNITNRRGFKIALTIQPYFSTQSPNYEEGLKESIWVEQNLPGSKQGVPALTSYKGATSVVLLDITKEKARIWIQKKLRALVKKYGIDALWVDLGSTHDFPQHYHFGNSLSTPDEYKEIFMKSIKTISSVYAIGTTSATKLPRLPTFVALSPIPSTWEGLQSLIPNILSLGVAGFPYIMPGVVGGDYHVSDSIQNPIVNTSNKILSLNQVMDIIPNNTNTTTVNNEKNIQNTTNSKILMKIEKLLKNNTFKSLKPNRELYARWLELEHFLPIVQYTYIPSDYDPKLVQLAKDLKGIRKLKLYPYIKKAINDALTTGLPVIRPIWMNDPNDTNCLKVWDEFTIGGDILVAPILYPNTTEREIYLPKGKWRDEMDGSSTKGERWIHHYKLKENQIAYFTKLEDPI